MAFAFGRGVRGAYRNTSITRRRPAFLQYPPLDRSDCQNLDWPVKTWEKSSRWFVATVGIALLVVLLGSFPCYAAAPVVSDIPDQTIAEGGSFATISLGDYVADVDNTDAEMTWTYSGNTELAVTIDGSRAASIGIPSADWKGSEMITFTAEDLVGGNDYDTAGLTVIAVNDSPVVSDIPDQTIAEGGSFATISLGDYVTDVDNTDAEMTWTYSGDTELVVTIDGSRVATIGISNADWYGFESITFTVTDPGFLSDSDPASFSVNSLNDAPVAQADIDITDQDIAVTLPVLANDSDPDGDWLLVESVTKPSSGTVTNNGTDVTYLPGPGFKGMDTFTYTVSDGNGGTDTAAVMVAVAVVNAPPVAQKDSGITDEGVAVTIRILANDSDPDGDRLMVESVRQPLNGTVTNNGTDVIYTPYPGYDGIDTFTYTVSDGSGGMDTETVTVDVLKSVGTAEEAVEDQPWHRSNAGVKLVVVPRDGVEVYGTPAGTGGMNGQATLVQRLGLNPPTLLIGFENTGTAHLTVTGEVQLIDLTGEVIEQIPVERFSVFPGAAYQVKAVSRSSSFLPGRYLALVVLDIDDPAYLLAGQLVFEVSELHLGPIGESANLPRDLDSDGLYEDINGDGKLTLDDLYLFGFGIDSEAVQENSQAFDFNNDGIADFNDVVLFKSIVEEQQTE